MAMSRALVQVLIPAARRFRTTVTTDILSRARERPMFADLQEGVLTEFDDLSWTPEIEAASGQHGGCPEQNVGTVVAGLVP